jgi:hypothetical protein
MISLWFASYVATKRMTQRSHRCRWCNQLNPEVKREPFTEEEVRAVSGAAIHVS